MEQHGAEHVVLSSLKTALRVASGPLRVLDTPERRRKGPRLD